MVEYYDLVLGLIPLVLAGGTGFLTGIGISLETALSIAALVTVGIIGHALFVHNPANAVDHDRRVAAD